jgi:hypothetical protein
VSLERKLTKRAFEVLEGTTSDRFTRGFQIFMVLLISVNVLVVIIETEYIAPIFAFSVLRMFDMEDIEEVFEMYDYSIVKSDIKPIRQRNFSGPKEKAETVSLLHDMKINTKKYEDDGNFYADFYIAKCNK